jgi:hypothetical protein
MKRVCLFCGSNAGVTPAYAGAARGLGAALLEIGAGLVYGGGNVGLMGIAADELLARGGEVIGVIPKALVTRELAHQGLTKLHVVRSMHERKAMMRATIGRTGWREWASGRFHQFRFGEGTTMFTQLL